MAKAYEKPDVSVDVVLLTLATGRLHAALHQRDKAPFKGALALPGGYIHTDEDSSLDDAVQRMLSEKTGLAPRYIEQLRTFGGPKRDPRGWSIAISYVALVPAEELSAAGAGIFRFYPVDDLPNLAFDHGDQVRAAADRVRNKSSYSTLPCWLLPAKFTLTQLQHTYEAVFGEAVSRATFRSRLGIRVGDVQPGEAVDDAGVLIATDEWQMGKQRPARLFRVDQLGLFRRASW
ncbi:NUDIX domain-containing protein [Trinickia caryophylli]|uniref:ADP-ribose pyrophosphatase YjhB, NUDIX family n=1 Tax=Trinickia caryophylli TaxID=28094 RepID=A0A1X7EH65_TRICW|nr:NUDIX domain-containing protein [Trinickia caryophylli]PMS11039.1 NUDIX domain-containing protein [Trinickia caryophylli]TRX14496.1 NUDIX hydrolase [Trinickia caryophylli]WQE14335.1 NUDIX domain-containing protein [Trinickia caryophylli]SMF33844.1 ADP-ribose pyrophosphatase YjhB, NUDIX family [Trinickia caryophylli]GLU32282.1 NUDIX hydrolase [Trinickia caryophylli]